MTAEALALLLSHMQHEPSGLPVRLGMSFQRSIDLCTQPPAGWVIDAGAYPLNASVFVSADRRFDGQKDTIVFELHDRVHGIAGIKLEVRSNTSASMPDGACAVRSAGYYRTHYPMLLLVPYEVRTLYQRNPWGNLAIIVLTIVSFVLAWTEALPDSLVDGMILGEGGGTAYLGYQFLHTGWWHLLGNMMFLFVFGNAVCGVMNTFLYVALYLAMGAAAGAVHMLLEGSPAVGASGALCGVMGMYLAIYPQNEINCFWFFMVRGGTVGMAGWLLILFWFGLDLFGAFGGKGNVAHWAHIGGTVVGFVTGLVLLKLGKVDLYDYDNPTVLQIFSRERAS